MDVIAGKVKNEHNPALSADGLAEAWAESITNIFPNDIDHSPEAQSHNDRMEFSKALSAKLFSAGIDDAEVSRDMSVGKRCRFESTIDKLKMTTPTLIIL